MRRERRNQKAKNPPNRFTVDFLLFDYAIVEVEVAEK
jgi:hypothetical protein